MGLNYCQFCFHEPVSYPGHNICEICYKFAVGTIKNKRARKLRTNDNGEICIKCMRFCRKEFMIKGRSYCVSCRSINSEKYDKKRKIQRDFEKINQDKAIQEFEQIEQIKLPSEYKWGWASQIVS